MKSWIRFEQIGINLDNIYVKRIWRVSQILNKDPWDPMLLDYPNHRLDFIIRAWAADNDRKIVEPEIQKGEHKIQILVEWSNRLMGDAKKLFDHNPALYLKKIGMPKHIMEKLFGKTDK